MKRPSGACLGWVLILFPLAAAAQTRPARPAVSADASAGKRIFDAQCAWCHGTDGDGGTGPNLHGRLQHATDLNSIVNIVVAGIPGTEMPSFRSPLTERSARQVAAYVRSLGRTRASRTSGDATRGADLYETRGCAICHVISGQGGVHGPDLTSIGASRGPTYLREALVKPEAAHPPGYLVVRAVQKSGGDIRGIRVNEDVFWILVRDGTGTLHTLRKSDLAEIERLPAASLMSSYASYLSPAETDDLVAYLSTLRGAK